MPMKNTTPLINHGSQSLIAKTFDGHTKPSAHPVFILCDRCYWCATYFSNARIPTDNICPQCNANSNQLTSFPIASNESFSFSYNDKGGVESEFKHSWKATTFAGRRYDINTSFLSLSSTVYFRMIITWMKFSSSANIQVLVYTQISSSILGTSM